MASRPAGIQTAPPGTRLPRDEDFVDPHANYFRDGREGVDRWGRERERLWACGSGFGEHEYVCQAYVEEACPGNKNPGDRSLPHEREVCALDCGECGSWGEKKLTIAYCGWKRGQPMWDAALAEMRAISDDTLRLDQVKAPPHEQQGPYPATYGPVLEAYAKDWLEQSGLAATMPFASTTMKTAGRSYRRTKQPIRDRLGGFEGYLVVNGYTKDDLIDDVWDDRAAVIDFCRRSEVDAMVTPQYSFYFERQPCMLLYNAHRIFRWYRECMEAGFPRVVLDLPSGMATVRYMEDFAEFIVRNEVKYVSLSWQQFKERGGLSPVVMRNAKLWHELLPADVHVLVFGLALPAKIAAAAKLMAGRSLSFMTVEPTARALFYEVMPSGTKAPAKWSKTDVFTHNYAHATKMTERAYAAARRKRPVAA